MTRAIMPSNGLFISFEGGDGVGKSTQLKLLSSWLRNAGHSVLETREPGGSDGAEIIRDLLVTGDIDRWTSLTEALLMYASRSEHLSKTILPALENGIHVLSDRFSDSSMAYQGYAGEVGQQAISGLEDIVVGPNKPDLTFIMSIDATEGLDRTQSRQNLETRFEDKGAVYQQNVEAAFRVIAADNPDRCVLIDASGSVEDVFHSILNSLFHRFPSFSHETSGGQ